MLSAADPANSANSASSTNPPGTASGAAQAQARHRSAVALPVVPAVWATLALLANVVMAELNRLVADVLDGAGASWSFADVFGLGRALSPSGGAVVWQAWESLGGTPPGTSGTSPAAQVSQLLAFHLGADLVFVAAYAALGARLLRRSRRTLRLLRALVLVDLLEDGCAAAIVGRIHGGSRVPGLPEQLIGWLSAAKWFLMVLVLVSAVLIGLGWAGKVRQHLLDPPGTAAGTAGGQASAPGVAGPRTAPLLPVLQAVWLHRFSLMALVPLAVLATGPGNEPLDQLPDVARSWVDDGVGARSFAWAGVGLVALVVALFVLGRLRSDRVWRERVPSFSAVRSPSPGPGPGATGGSAKVEGRGIPGSVAAGAGSRSPGWRAWVRRVQGWPVTLLPVQAWQAPVRTVVGPAAPSGSGPGEPPGCIPALRAPAPGLWLLAPGLVMLAAAVAELLGVPVGWRPALVWMLMGVAAFGLSALASRSPRGCRWPVYQADPQLARTTVVVGDVASLSMVVLAGVGLARAHTASAAVEGSAAAWLLLGLGAAAAVLVWPVGERLRERLARRPGVRTPRVLRWLSQLLTPGRGLDTATASDHGLTAQVRARTWLRTGLAAMAVLILLVLGTAPVRVAHVIGVLASTEFAVAALVLLIGVVVVVSRDHLPLPVFRWLGLRSTPLAGLIVLGVLVVSIQTGDPAVHGVRGLGSDPSLDPVTRPTLRQTFDRWLSISGACDQVFTLTGGQAVRVRPMLLVAADGGGIRAAYWTVSALAKLRERGGDCGSHAILLSVGVSGGSLGLALAQRAADPVAEVNAVAEQDALAAAALGFLVRDDAAVLTGVRLPSLLAGDLSGNPRQGWQDRAALMEGIWQRQAPSLAGSFLAGSLGAPTGPLVLTSTSVGTGCRVLVSQLRFPASRQEGGTLDRYDPSCRNGSAALPSTFDLLADYGPRGGLGGPRCLGGLSASTAVMLSARFPYVTPSGVVGQCRELAPQQLVDGGYAESTGLGTLIDLAGRSPGGSDIHPGWADLVREHNARAMVRLLDRPTADPDQAPAFLAPVAVFLQNHFHSDIAASASKPSDELLVPIHGKEARSAQYDTATLLQRARALTTPDVPCPVAGLCVQVREKIQARAPNSVIVVAPDTRPAVTAPLGWVLSGISRRGLDDTLTRQADVTCQALGEKPPLRRSPDCQAGYGRLADLFRTLQPVRGSGQFQPSSAGASPPK